jgi:hypothetical protein
VCGQVRVRARLRVCVRVPIPTVDRPNPLRRCPWSLQPQQ